MNPAENRPIDPAAIDRLVDGELAADDRRALLLALEADPDGWRRCALAFLEDQGWRQALTAPRFEAPAGPATRPASPSRARPRPARFAVAAGVIAATFLGGFKAGGMSREPARVEVVKADPKPAIPTNPPLDEIREVGWINLVDRSAGESPPERVPILSGPGLDDRWLRDRPSAVPDYVRARCEREGYRVEERRRLVSLDLDDGRRVSIPVDEVEVQYVGQKPL